MIETVGLKLALAAMASWQIVETLRHGSLFKTLRRWGNKIADDRDRDLIRVPLVNLSAKLAICAFCQSHWAPLLPLLAMFYGPAWTQFLIVSLAVTRAAQLLNDLTYPFNRSPPSDEELQMEESVRPDGQYE